MLSRASSSSSSTHRKRPLDRSVSQHLPIPSPPRLLEDEKLVLRSFSKLAETVLVPRKEIISRVSTVRVESWELLDGKDRDMCCYGNLSVADMIALGLVGVSDLEEESSGREGELSWIRRIESNQSRRRDERGRRHTKLLEDSSETL